MHNSGHCVAENHKYIAKFLRFVLIYPIENLFVLQNFSSLVSFLFQIPLQELNPIQISLFLISITDLLKHLFQQFNFLFQLGFHPEAKFLTYSIKLMQLIINIYIELQTLYSNMCVGQRTCVMGPRIQAIVFLNLPLII